MRILLMILVLIVLPALSTAGELYSTFTSVLQQSRREQGLTIASSEVLSDTNGYCMIRDGMVMLSPLIKGNQVEWTLPTLYKTYRYAIDSNIVKIEDVWWESGDSIKPITYLPRDKWIGLQSQTTSGQSGQLKRPSVYDYTDDYLYLYPAPSGKNGADTIRVLGYKSIGNIDTVRTLTHLDQEHRVAIQKYVTWRSALAGQDPRTEIFYKAYLEAVAIIERMNQRGPIVEESK